MPLNRPGREELLQAVIDYLQQDLLPASMGSQAFHLRVIIRVLGIVLRELQLGDAYQQQECENYNALLGKEVNDVLSELCQQIEQGHWDDNPELLRILRDLADAKLAIDSPDYR